MSGLVLETPRLILRPFTTRDAGDLLRFAGDPRVALSAGWEPPRSFMESWLMVQTVFMQPDVFALELKETGRVIGSVALTGGHPAGELPDCPDDEAAFALDPEYWGQGVTAEAMDALERWAFTQLGLHRLWCVHYAGNWRCGRFAAKRGYRYRFARTTEVDQLRQARQTYFYMLTEEDWRERVHRALCGYGE